MILDALVRATTREADVETELPGDVEVRRARWIPAIGGRLSGMGGPASAVALGGTIVVHPDARPSPRLLRHELEHVRQWRRHPLTFALRYTWNHLRHGYRDNPYEVAARRAEENEDERTAEQPRRRRTPGRSA